MDIMETIKQWDETIDTQELTNNIKELNNNDFEEVPVGKYEVSIQNLELGTSSTDKPMLKCQFKIVAGKHRKSRLFYNQVLTEPFPVYKANQFLKSLGAVDESKVEFKTYNQYAILVMEVFEAIKDNNLEYLIEYTKNANDYPEYRVKEIYNN